MNTEKKYNRQTLIKLLDDKERAQEYLDSVPLEGADLSCLNLAGYSFHGRYMYRTNFSESNLSRTDFTNARLAKAILYRAVLEEANFHSAKLHSAGLSETKMQYIDLTGAEMRRAYFDKANLYRAKMANAIMEGAYFREADLTEADLRHAYMNNIILTSAILRKANLTDARLEDADLTNANLKAAILTGSSLKDAIMRYTNLSGAVGLPTVSDYMAEHFERTEEGYIVYKSFSQYYDAPDYWKIKKGSIITEAVNPNRTETCGCGINVGTLNWVTECSDDQIYKLLIRWEWLGDTIVPYNSTGKIRCGKAMILGAVGIRDYEKLLHK